MKRLETTGTESVNCGFHWSHNSYVSADWSSTSQPTKTMTRSWLPVYPATLGKQTMTHIGIST